MIYCHLRIPEWKTSNQPFELLQRSAVPNTERKRYLLEQTERKPFSHQGWSRQQKTFRVFSLGHLFRPPLSSVNEKKKSEQDKHVTICAQKEQRFLSIVHRTGSRKRSSRRMAGEGEGGGGFEAGECARSKFTASSPAESRSTEHFSFFVIC